MATAARSRQGVSRIPFCILGRREQRIALVALLFAAFVAPAACQRARPEEVNYEPGRFDIDWSGYSKTSREVRSSLDQKFSEDIRELVVEVGKPHVQNALRATSNRPPPKNDFEILKIEEQWTRSSPTSAFVTERIDRYCSLELQAFQRANPEFVEIFITNKAGFNVCQTNKTTDYYQGDEDWWKTTMQTMRPSHGPLIYDRSAKTSAVPAYIPVHDRESSGALGVAKAMIRRDARSGN
jgi:hypothetical protein